MANSVVLSQPRTDASGPYAGSRFADVVDAITANPYQRVWGAAGEPALPVYEVTLRTVVGGLASFGFPKQFRADSMRTLDSPVDLRWGPDGNGFRRLVHPNGVCLTGRWTIDQERRQNRMHQRRRAAQRAPTPRSPIAARGSRCS